MARDLVPLPELAPALRREYGTAPTYRKLHGLVQDGLIPAERRAGRILIDLTKAAEALGLRAPDAQRTAA